MEPAELDREIEELETRVERLRALYEQYFLGIEKIEPLVPKKDVERRIWRLRHEQIRNTGKRFRLQNVIQRYNTFQQYWLRICREIEGGTYTRHLARARRIMADAEPLTIAARKRHRARQRAIDKLEEEEELKRERAEVATRGLEDLADLLDQPGALDSAMQSVDRLLSAPEPPLSTPSDPAPQASLPPLRLQPPLKPPRGRPHSGRQDSTGSTGGQVAPALQPGSPTPGRPSVGPSAQALPIPPVPGPSGRPLPVPPVPGASGRPLPAPPVPGPSGRPLPGPPVPVPSGRPLPGLPMPRPFGRPLAGPLVPGPSAPPSPGPRAPGPTPGPTFRSPPDPRKVAGGPAAPQGTPGGATPRRIPPPAAATRAPRPVTPPRASTPPTARSQAASGTVPPYPSSTSRGTQRRTGTGLTDNRVLELHSRLTAAKRRTNDSSSVSVDGLRRSLQSAEARLLKKHGNHRTVDFDIVIKDGKAVIKPVVR